MKNRRFIVLCAGLDAERIKSIAHALKDHPQPVLVLGSDLHSIGTSVTYTIKKGSEFKKVFDLPPVPEEFAKNMREAAQSIEQLAETLKSLKVSSAIQEKPTSKFMHKPQNNYRKR